MDPPVTVGGLRHSEIDRHSTLPPLDVGPPQRPLAETAGKTLTPLAIGLDPRLTLPIHLGSGAKTTAAVQALLVPRGAVIVLRPHHAHRRKTIARSPAVHLSPPQHPARDRKNPLTDRYLKSEKVRGPIATDGVVGIGG